jgi:ATP-dependent Lhr-like helicase
VEPVDQQVLGRFDTTWQGIVKRRQGADALLDAIEQLQGSPLPASILETEILPARIDVYDPADLDVVTAAGEVIWVGVEALGERDGRIALYLADHLPRLLAPSLSPDTDLSEREIAILDYLREHGASFFAPILEAAGGGFPAETVDVLWNLVWRGLVTNDTFHALRAFTRTRVPRRKARLLRRADVSSFRSRRLAPPSAEGRWTLVGRADVSRRRQPSERSPKGVALGDSTKWAAAMTQQLLARHGVLTRESLNVEALPGGFGLLYPVLKGLEENGRIRRGYFVAGLGATQFALPGALDLLRSLREKPDDPEIAVLAATDPANPYGAALKWPAFAPGGASAGQAPEHRSGASAGQAREPQSEASARQVASDTAKAGRGPTRSVGATVVLVNGSLAAYLARGDRQLVTYLPESEPERSKTARAVARVLIDRARTGGESPRGMLIEEIDGVPSATHPIAKLLTEAGFVSGALGLQARLDRVSRPSPVVSHQSQVVSRQSKSSVSSPFARRYFDDSNQSDD